MPTLVRRIDRDTILTGVAMQPHDVHEARIALETVAGRLHRAGDARAVFPDVYALITRRVCDGILGAPGATRFCEPEALSALDARFAERYLYWLDRSLRGLPLESTAWRLACDYGARGLTLPAQDAMLGISAHINSDLAQGICDNIESLGHARDVAMIARYKRDHDAVNTILRGAVGDCLALLVERHGCRFTEALTRFDACRTALCEALLLTFTRWREHVWQDTLDLLDAPVGPSRDRVLARTGLRAARIATALCAGNLLVATGRPLMPAPAWRVLARVGNGLRATAPAMG